MKTKNFHMGNFNKIIIVTFFKTNYSAMSKNVIVLGMKNPKSYRIFFLHKKKLMILNLNWFENSLVVTNKIIQNFVKISIFFQISHLGPIFWMFFIQTLLGF